MEFDQILKLIEAVTRFDLVEFELEREGVRVRIKRERSAASPQREVVREKTETVEVVAESEDSVPSEVDEFPPHLAVIRSPIVGTFYRAPAPDAPPYVEEGDIVDKGQVLCIVEAMKIMNEIESDVKGKVVKILVENAQPVEYGQPLFLIEPLE